MPIIKKLIIRFICLTAILMGAGSCTDEIDFGTGQIPEGWSRVTVKIDFTQFMPTNLGSRSSGDTFDYMRNLFILVYDEKGEELLKTKEITITAANPDNRKEATDVLELPCGKYQIYAVANVDDLLTTYAEQIKTAEGLKNIELRWETGETGGLGQNDQMMGYFVVQSATEGNFPYEYNPLIIIDKRDMTIKSHVIRAASKVTVSYDGSSLKDGVKIFIKSLSIKKIPKVCYLGAENKITDEKDLEDGEEIVYFPGNTTFNDSYPGLITKQQPFFPSQDQDPHGHTSEYALFFYENLQGEGPDKRQKDVNGDGVLDNLYGFNEVPYATYIEVEAYYESVNPDRPGVDNVIYRFALGEDIVSNYDAMRNHHYKLTLHFNGFANEPDWRVDHIRFFDVDRPHDVNYKGEYFVPNTSINNLGDDFRDDNAIVIKSFQYPKDSWTDYVPVNYKVVEYRDSINGEFRVVDKAPDWFTIHWDNDLAIESDRNRGIHKFLITYKNDYSEVDIDDLLKKTTAPTGTVDLANVGGKRNTANSYIVSGKGTYSFPLAYGNAIVDGNDNTSAYSGFGTGDRVLSDFQNYLGKPIKKPYVIDDAKEYASEQAVGTITTDLVWEDVQGLIDLSTLRYVSTLYDNHGGIQFTIGDNIKQGNAVIAIKNGDKIMWSWHIWVTAFDLDRSVTFTNHAGEAMTVMPVNLGWCSNGAKVRYYDRHVCKIRFEQDRIGEGGETYYKEITIVQEPHITVPMGDNPYYQWGRKDPFPGADIVTGGGVSKQWWYQTGTTITEWNRWAGTGYDFAGYRTLNPYTDPNKNDRDQTKDILGTLIQKPNFFNNPKFKGFVWDEDAGKRKPGTNDDETYSNLWSNTTKTVYDPAPYGYRVNPLNTFTGLTYTGGDITIGEEDGAEDDWFSVTEANMQDGYKFANGLFEFYTNRSKLVSLPFPLSGYIDYDQVVIIWLFKHGYIWEATNINEMSSNFFKYIPNADGHWDQWNRPTVAPISGYYTTDGCSVRPYKETPAAPAPPASLRRR